MGTWTGPDAIKEYATLILSDLFNLHSITSDLDFNLLQATDDTCHVLINAQAKSQVDAKFNDGVGTCFIIPVAYSLHYSPAEGDIKVKKIAMFSPKPALGYIWDSLGKC